MIRIPLGKHRAYQLRLSELNIPGSQKPHYVKWVRYFLDYEMKYGREQSSDEKLQGFMRKLASKGQSESLRRQAGKAVELYLRLENIEAAEIAEKAGAAKEISVRPASKRVSASKAGAKAKARIKASDPVVGANAGGWNQALDKMESEIRRRDYSPKTLSTYTSWIRKFASFTGYTPAAEITDAHAQAFLTDLAVEKEVVASTQNQAFNALLFLFRHVLQREYELGDRVVRAKQSQYIPTVLTREEVDAVLDELEHPFDLIVSLLYGCGLRISEVLTLRIGDLDFEEELVVIHDGKGRKDRSVPLPKRLKRRLKKQVTSVARLLDRDLKNPDYGGVFMPQTLSRGRAKREAKDIQWQWLFPAKELTLVPDEGLYRRHHNYRQHLSMEIRRAARRAKVPKRVTAHTFRHSFASHLLAANYDIHTVQKLLGHSDVKTTMIYTHTVKSRTNKEKISPLDLD